MTKEMQIWLVIGGITVYLILWFIAALVDIRNKAKDRK